MAAQGINNRSTDEGFRRALEEGDQLAEIMEQEGMRMMSMAEIKQGLDDIAHGKKDWAEQTEEESEEIDHAEDLELLLEESTPVLPQREEFQTPPQNLKGKEKAEEEDDAEQPDLYAESFASQRETAQLREEVETMSGEIESLKTTINALLKEREALPGHLTTIREDINRQMTTMLDKLHSALESNLPSQNVQAATTAVTEIQNLSIERLKAAADYAADKPRESSPIATKGAKLEGKRRFRPVK